ncbi:unnamed protein product [Staurois parvus]|uniref:DEK-C domain-containing protein n=1 Tax=Staurois parvus TaxID=386267 RepID=A0ABN9EPK2_9NEOB|nr:unnamed protein product [Staurois parvus]
MSSDVSDSLTKEETEAVEQVTEENVIEDAANGSEGGENEEEEEDDEEEDDKKEKSLIVEGKREKKKVERLSLEMTVINMLYMHSLPGKGQKLYDIERISYFLKKKKCEELRLLHRLLFNRPGTVFQVKRNIGQFNGFAFDAGSEQYKKKEDLLKKFKKSDLKNICGILDLEKSGANVELISRILTFLLKPKSTGKSLPKSKTQRSSKKERSSSASARKSKSSKSNVILTDESSSEDEKKDKESSEEEKESEEEEGEPPKKAAKKEKAKPKSTPKSKRATKSANVKKADSSTTNKKSKGGSKKESESGDSSDDEPLIKKLRKPPTDEEIQETVKQLLAEANLEEVTMKQICKKVNECYPTYDLSSRKEFIKATVKEVCV